AIETSATTRRNDVSLAFSREAWMRLERAFERAIRDPSNDEARADMLLGAHLAGCAIEHSMLGAAHACANPLTALFGIAHGIAVGIMLPHVVRFNGAGRANAYEALGLASVTLADRVERFLKAAELPRRLRDVAVPENALATLAEEAAQQWTATFNPTQVGARELLAIYQASWA
ncbi:MAG: iron-containing alcohol dehydrogenase, partial [Phycisphaerales bacterium]|nr:iron-containing alcohol dehydrogenase [Phycisphaerales bacterium]